MGGPGADFCGFLKLSRVLLNLSDHTLTNKNISGRHGLAYYSRQGHAYPKYFYSNLLRGQYTAHGEDLNTFFLFPIGWRFSRRFQDIPNSNS